MFLQNSKLPKPLVGLLVLASLLGNSADPVKVFSEVSKIGLIPGGSSNVAPLSQSQRNPVVQVDKAEKEDRSPARLDATRILSERGQGRAREAEPVRLIRPRSVRGARPASPSTPDTSIQRSPGSKATAKVINLFSGIGSGLANSSPTLPAFQPNNAPPDTNGSVGGPTSNPRSPAGQYVQWVNSAFAVFEKTKGVLLYGPAEGRTLWRGFGGPCERNNDGDPIAQYDKISDRWVLAQFVVHASNGAFYQCMAVSDTSDALGTYRRYSFKYGNFDDYPKMGVWPDGYYTTFNMFRDARRDAPFIGAKICAYDRRAMLGQVSDRPVSQQCVQLDPQFGGLLPADLDGENPPPVDAPNYLLSLSTDSVYLWKFSPDWKTPANSKLIGPVTIPLGTFDEACNGSDCVPQKGTAQRLDTLADRLMYRLAYRHFDDGHESLLFNHSVAVNNGRAAIRWYELREPGGSPTIYQKGTFAPDGNYRWMGSIAMDKLGNIGVGYSLSNSTVFPSIRFAGRNPEDPLGQLQQEILVIDGKGSQQLYCTGQDGKCLPECSHPDGSCDTFSRWGDYSSLSMDPSDDCTMWYTTEYLERDGSYNWSTVIAPIKFESCH